ncbi:uncharacterized protein B0T15DRAFT_571021 [Chaetomium strumarium]|uniref:Uncharacterized protein n=1 Tax=Chaetomium strumarium TaxID=1170767 RepID=A0AAJ0H268_9PEZI|nr:hypothetical protein B0T15DRAFT_571021 [Chaetomium strumarium]
MFTSLSLIVLLGQPLFWMLEAVVDASAALGCFSKIQAFLSKAPRAEHRVIIPCHSSGSLRGVDAKTDGSDIQPAVPTGNVELQELAPAGDSQDKVDVTVRNASFSWPTDGPGLLDRINMDVRESGQKQRVLGPSLAIQLAF